MRAEARALGAILLLLAAAPAAAESATLRAKDECDNVTEYSWDASRLPKPRFERLRAIYGSSETWRYGSGFGIGLCGRYLEDDARCRPRWPKGSGDAAFAARGEAALAGSRRLLRELSEVEPPAELAPAAARLKLRLEENLALDEALLGWFRTQDPPPLRAAAARFDARGSCRKPLEALEKEARPRARYRLALRWNSCLRQAVRDAHAERFSTVDVDKEWRAFLGSYAIDERLAEKGGICD